MSERVEHKIGQVVSRDDVDPRSRVPRLAGKKFSVRLGTSCTQCCFAGLGHVVCPEIACSQHDRSDMRSVVYGEVEEDGDG